MTLSITYDPDRNALYVAGIVVPFPAGSLEARRSGDMLAVANPHADALVCAWTRFDDWSVQGQSGFASVDEAYALLAATCSRKRSMGEVFGASVVAGANLFQGQPVAVSRATGQLLPAQADTYALAFVAGLVSADTQAGFANRPMHGAVTLPDWMMVTGTPALTVGLPYFLGAEGGLTAAPDQTTACLTRVGYAVAPATLVVAPLDPILL